MANQEWDELVQVTVRIFPAGATVLESILDIGLGAAPHIDYSECCAEENHLIIVTHGQIADCELVLESEYVSFECVVLGEGVGENSTFLDWWQHEIGWYEIATESEQVRLVAIARALIEQNKDQGEVIDLSWDVVTFLTLWHVTHVGSWSEGNEDYETALLGHVPVRELYTLANKIVKG